MQHLKKQISKPQAVHSHQTGRGRLFHELRLKIQTKPLAGAGEGVGYEGTDSNPVPNSALLYMGSTPISTRPVFGARRKAPCCGRLTGS